MPEQRLSLYPVVVLLATACVSASPSTLPPPGISTANNITSGSTTSPVPTLAPTETPFSILDQTASALTTSAQLTPATPGVTAVSSTVASPVPLAAPANPYPLPLPATTNSDGIPACDHPYLPVQPGAYWVYEQTEQSSNPAVTGPGPVTLRWAVSDVQSNSVIFSVTDSLQTPFSLTIQCNTASGISPGSYDYTMGGFNRMFYLYLPPAEKLSPGYSWSELIHHLDLGGGM